MLAEQRHQYILSELGRSGALSVAELVRSLDVSRETIRRDLNALAARGRSLQEANIDEMEELWQEAKQK